LSIFHRNSALHCALLAGAPYTQTEASPYSMLSNRQIFITLRPSLV
jgi:hypothetical protein